MNIIVAVVGGLLALVFIMSGGNKVLGTKQAQAQRAHLKLPAWFWRLTGALELLGALGLIVGYFVPAVAGLAAALLLIIMLGAVAAHLARRDPISRAIPAFVLFALAALTLAGRWADLIHWRA